VHRLETELKSEILSAAELRARLANEPLTLEELREMDGEPVYLIVDDQYEPLKMWALIEVVETANCVILTSNLGGRNEYYDNDEMKDDGVTAYRRPPEGEA
jgi:hypothetical protein